jgi:ubiquinone/menaquinone biosynthesis C-methylase UbiE
MGRNAMDKNIIAEGPNSEEIDYWNGQAGQNWINENRLTDIMYQPFGNKAVERAQPISGERILEIGCGCGTTTLVLAKLVGDSGAVTALDVSSVMLEVAHKRAVSASAPVNFLNADAETYSLDPESYDVVFSQFGVMFFANPAAAFTHFHQALKPGGRLAFVCWRGPEQNPFMMVPFNAVHSFMPSVAPPNPDAPASPLSFESKEKVGRMLEDAGFVDALFEPFEAHACMGQGSLEECTRFVIAFAGGTVGAVMRGAGEEKVPAIVNALQDSLAPFHTGDRIELGASAWIVSARRP